MFTVCARNYHSYNHLILTLGIVREPTVWGFITSKYSCTHGIGPARIRRATWRWVVAGERMAARKTIPSSAIAAYDGKHGGELLNITKS